MAHSEIESRPDVIYIRDGKERVELRRTTVGGVEVWTPSPEKARELDERFKKMVAKPEPARK